jgi:integrase
MGEVLRKVKDGRFIGWYIRYTDENGTRRQRASKQPTQAEARRLLSEVEARIARSKLGLEPPRIATLSLSALIDRFCAQYERPKLKNLAEYRRVARSVLRRVSREAPQLADVRLANLTQLHIVRLREALGRRYPSGTVRATLIKLSAVFSWAVRERLLPANPMRGVEQPVAAPHREDWLEADEVRKLLDAAKRTAQEKGLLWHSRYIAIALGVYLGLRRGEIFGLRWQDVDLKHARITVARSYLTLPKSGKPRHLRLPQELCTMLAEWQNLCPPSLQNVVCPVPYKQAWQLSRNTTETRGLPALLRAAGCRVLQRPWHALRHTFASNYLRQGGNIVVLQRLLGHAEVRTTMVYAHLAADYLAEEMQRIKY